VDALVQPGAWRDALDGSRVEIGQRIEVEVPAHGVRVLLRDAPVDAPALREVLRRRMQARAPRTGADTTSG
jgi:cyclomaltodextrin glucanotransferase